MYRTAFQFLTLGLILFAAPFSFAQTSNSQVHWVSPDFFVEEGYKTSQSLHGGLESLSTQDCRATIAAKTCLVEPGDSSGDRVCLDGSAAYAKPFEDVYDHLPPTFQRMFCSIQKIYIEKQFGATAYAGASKNGPVIGVRKSVIDEDLSFAKWATWKEQLAFGGNKNSYEPTRGLPFYVTPVLSDVNTFLYQLIVHEFGHQFDFANGLNAYADGCGGNQECAFKEGTWGSLSWATNARPLPENDFLNRDKFCFYSCGNSSSPATIIPDLYVGLYNSAFINAYASTETWDDFADSLAYYAISTYLHTSIVFDTAQGQTYDLTAKLHSDRFAKKLKFIEDFLARTDIRYP